MRVQARPRIPILLAALTGLGLAVGASVASCGADQPAAGAGGAAPTHRAPPSTPSSSSLPVVTIATYDGSSSSGVGGVDTTWAPLPLLASVDGCQGDYLLQPSSWPKPAWQPCGVGCLAANPIDDPSTEIGADLYQSAADGAGQELYYRTYAVGSTYQYNILRRLSDDAALFVTRISSTQGPVSCGSSLGKELAPFVFEAVGGDSIHTWVGYYDLDQGTLRMPQAIFPTAIVETSWFTWAGGWGLLSGDSAVRILEASDPTSLLTVTHGTTYVYPAHAHEGLVAWVDWTTFPATMGSWTSAHGARALFQAPADVAGFAFSDRVLAFVHVTGPQTADGYYRSASVYWTPFTEDPGAIRLIEGPDISGYVEGALVMATGGDIVAIRSWPAALQPDDMGVVVVKMSTAEAYRIHPAAGTYLDVAAVSEKELLAYEIPVGADPDSFTSWKRFDLSQLDAFAAPLIAQMDAGAPLAPAARNPRTRRAPPRRR